jgi:ubiquinone/menaquinone biosynthesis C-methylase UbiE
MSSFILRPNAVAVYGFLSRLVAQGIPADAAPRPKILDCGAGGAVPPAALFASHGFEAFGVDISRMQLDKARLFCNAQGIEVALLQADMRQLPFGNESFDHIYEHYAMCHLSKADTVKAVDEMRRVLKPGGMAFLGVISLDCWPKSLFGEMQAPGEFQMLEDGEPALHSMFGDAEADDLFTDWEIIDKKKQVRYLREEARQTTLTEWMNLLSESDEVCSQDDWRMQYINRTNDFQYVHLYFTLQKPHQ